MLESLKRISLPGRARRFVAVDFDSRQLRVVQAESAGNRVRILKTGGVEMPEGLDITNARQMGEFLGEALGKMRLGGASVLMNVPRGQAVLKPVALPPGTGRAEMASMVQYQMEKELPFPTAEAVIDFTIERHYDAESAEPAEPVEEASTNLLVSAVRIPVLDYYRQVALAAKVRLVRLGLRPYANLRCVQACTVREEQECVALVNITADETEIDVIEGQALSFSRSAVVKVPPPDEMTELAVKKSVGEVVTEVARSFQSYQAIRRGGGFDAVLVAGGTGIEGQVAESLGRRLGVQCELFDPSVALRIRETEGASAFISAAGLAVGSIGAERPPFDFLNPKRPSVKRDVKKIRMAAVAAGVALLVGAAVAAAAIHLSSKSAELAKLRVERAEEKKTHDENVKLAKRMGAIEDWAADSRHWIDHWTQITALFPSPTEAYISKITTNTDGSIGFTLQASSSEVTTQFCKRLEEAGYDPRRGRSEKGEDRYGCPYSTVLRIFLSPRTEIDLAKAEPAARPSDDVAPQLFRSGEWKQPSRRTSPPGSSRGGR